MRQDLALLRAGVPLVEEAAEREHKHVDKELPEDMTHETASADLTESCANAVQSLLLLVGEDKKLPGRIEQFLSHHPVSVQCHNLMKKPVAVGRAKKKIRQREWITQKGSTSGSNLRKTGGRSGR